MFAAEKTFAKVYRETQKCKSSIGDLLSTLFFFIIFHKNYQILENMNGSVTGSILFFSVIRNTVLLKKKGFAVKMIKKSKVFVDSVNILNN